MAHTRQSKKILVLVSGKGPYTRSELFPFPVVEGDASRCLSTSLRSRGTCHMGPAVTWEVSRGTCGHVGGVTWDLRSRGTWIPRDDPVTWDV